jgi:serine/threonine protein kinase
MNSVIYQQDGAFKTSFDKFKGQYYFQKMINSNDPTHRNELFIAQKLLQNPQPNVVRVLDISYKGKVHIKYELLDIEKEFNPSDKSFLFQIKNGLRNLNNLDIIYIDLKDDNIGFDSKTNQWKIFDFDCSGVCKSSKTGWFLYPPEYYRMKEINELIYDRSNYIKDKKMILTEHESEELERISKKISLTKYDELAFYINFKTF